MNQDPEAWARVGARIRSDRERQGLSRPQLADRVVASGLKVTSRTIATLEKGDPPKNRPQKPSLEPTVAALGWLPGSVDLVLAGGEPRYESDSQEPPPGSPVRLRTPVGPTRADVLELLPRVNEFSRLAVAAGGDPTARDAFDTAAERLVDSVPADPGAKKTYGLAAYRPHAEGEPIPEDDQERMLAAMERNR
jgi:transcriptional regulator with XRE-family HTH domain